ncbi:MAG: DUF2723 domain-containing protein [Brumimicrobium sp.]|mgnify:CR=1 FL=1|nr:DUF2723 domain-containing protein [Brumimicrobium sp.]
MIKQFCKINSKQAITLIFKKFYPEITGIIVFISYLFTVSRFIGENDSGELAMCQATLSIPHPTGYPLFILIGFLFSKLPLFLTLTFQLNLLNSIWCAFTVVILIKISSIILNNLNLLLNAKGHYFNQINKPEKFNIIVPSIFSGFMLAYSATFWLQSTRVEVYSLQIFLCSLIILFLLKRIVEFEKEEANIVIEWFDMVKRWSVIFILLGFGFSNHMMTLYFLPALFIIFFTYHKINSASLKALFFLLFIVGIISSLFYLGLIILANASPMWSYGDPSNFQRLFDHVSAKEYSKLMMSGISVVSVQGAKLLKMLSFNFSTNNFSAGEFALSFLLGISGLFLLILFKKKIIYFFLVILITSILLTLNYNIPDINEYFLIPFLILSILSIIPIYIVLNSISKSNLLRRSSYLLLVVLTVIEFNVNFNYANRSNSDTIEKFIKVTINELPKNSILLTDSWGLIMSPGLFVQNVEKIREDVKIISPAGMILHEWYRKFQNFQLFDSNKVIRKIENLFLTYDVVFNSIQKGVIFLPSGSKLIPQSFYFKVVYDNSYVPLYSIDYNITRNINSTIPSDEQIAALIPFMLDQRIQFELKSNRFDKAVEYYQIIKSKFKNYIISTLTQIELIRYDLL